MELRDLKIGDLLWAVYQGNLVGLAISKEEAINEAAQENKCKSTLRRVRVIAVDAKEETVECDFIGDPEEVVL